ncbi:hypothetical protein ACROYT_G024706 [Oculina patagonica]
MRITTILILAFITFVMVELSEAATRRSSSSSSGSRRRSTSSTSGSRRRSSSSPKSSSSKPKITKYTPIKPKTIKSPVIVRQTKAGSRSSAFKRFVVGYLAYRYAFSSAPVYRQGYPMYRNYVSIPKNRAVRLSYEEEKLMDSRGNLCLGKSAKSQTLREGIDGNLVELYTTIKYLKTGKTVKLYGINNKVSLEDVKDQNFEVTSRARYNDSIVAETSCSQVEKRIVGTMVEMYETNPNSARIVYINYKLLLASIAMAGFIAFFKAT